ncbi:hypothetical protein HPB51_023712 [Rhipicephalus microplus]|uniref:Uncharacterized protein n=1 Tax=Rhipicephalus microplus TaxID=6941 RepID=A0A9J6E448_RHIMP|nr:hypothetical protein HPB51_023712 [Rhipicephalus microplus]
MDAPVNRQAETTPPEPGGKWILLQDDGDAAKEALLEEQDSDAGSIQNVGLHVLAALASLVGCNALQALFISLKDFSTATLSSATSFTATRFLSLVAYKASTVKRPELYSLLESVVVANIFIIPAACFTCSYEVGAGVTSLLRTAPHFLHSLDNSNCRYVAKASVKAVFIAIVPKGSSKAIIINNSTIIITVKQ